MNTAKKTVTLAHKTWLAGIAAYDSGREKSANKLDQLFVDGSAFVNTLLEKGETVETQIQVKLKAKKMLQEKISTLLAKFGLGNESRDQQIDILSQRVDSLIEVVAKLAQQSAAEKKMTITASVTKKAPSKAVATDIASKTPVKTAAKKTVIKVPAKTVAKPVTKAAATKAPAKPAAAKPASKPKAVVKD